MKHLKLTRLEREILNHRLEVPDALAEVLEEYHPEDVVVMADLLRKDDRWAAERLNVSLMNNVLAEAVQGSAYLGAASQESVQKQVAILRAGESLADKIGEYIGRKILFPNY